MILKELRQVTLKTTLVLIKKGVEIFFKGSFEEIPNRLDEKEINYLYLSFVADNAPRIIIIIK